MLDVLVEQLHIAVICARVDYLPDKRGFAQANANAL